LKRYRGIFFDFWETISVVREVTDPSLFLNRVIEKMMEVLRKNGHEVEREVLFGEVKGALERRERLWKMGLETSSWLSFAKVLDSLNIQWEGPLVALLRKGYREVAFEMGLEPRVGLEEVLKALRAKGLKVIILSNTSQGDLERRFLEENDLLQYFNALVFSVEVGFRKPREEIFKEALNLVKLDPKAVIHVGDSPEIDVLGENLVGIDTCWLKDRKRSYPKNLPKPTYVIKDLKEVLQIVS